MSTTYILPSAVAYPVALWINAPEPAFVGCRSDNPFTLYLSAEDPNPHTIHLYAQHSLSIPAQTPQNKWSHLVPQWRFLDESGYIINSIIPTASSLIYDVSGETIGMIASANFYYVDDLPTDQYNPILIWAIVDFSEYPVSYDETTASIPVSGFANSKVGCVVPYYINGLEPTHLDITQNGITDLATYYWKNTRIAHTITIMGEVSDVSNCTELSCSSILFDIPITNALGLSAGQISREVLGIPVSSSVWYPNSGFAYLSAVDVNDLPIGGFYRNEVKVGSTTTNAQITAGVGIYYHRPIIHRPYVWVSNPEYNTLNRLNVPYLSSSYYADITAYLHAESIILNQPYDISSLQVNTLIDVMAVSGFGGIYGMAITPCGEVWASDAESDRIYRFSSQGALLSTLNLRTSAMLGMAGITPAGISLDSNGDVWVCFFDSMSSVKIDQTTGAILTTINPGMPDPLIDPLFTVYPSGADVVFKPTLVETDLEDSVWVSYTNTISSTLYHYTSTGSYVSSITLPMCSNPMDILIDSDNNIWVTLTYHAGPPYFTGDVQKYDHSTGVLLCSISATHPEYITMDYHNAIWFTDSWNTVTKVTSGGNVYTYTVGSMAPSSILLSSLVLDENALEGICCDYYNRIHVINSYESTLYSYSTQTSAFIPYGGLGPNNGYINMNIGGYVVPVSAVYNKSAQAFGDWSGTRWSRKYDPNFWVDNNQVLYKYITGSSSLFDIEDLQGDYNIRRFNESWDASNVIHTFARSPHIHDNPKFWDEYMYAVWGDANSEEGKAFGRQVYERTNNFVKNQADIDTCNIDQLYSIAQEADVPIDNYNFQFPPTFRRLMDIISVNQQQLWGSRCQCYENIIHDYRRTLSGSQWVDIEYECDRCGHQHAGNRGTLFSPVNYTVSAYIPFIISDKYLNFHHTLVVPPVSTHNVSAGYTECGDLIISATNAESYALSSCYYWLLPNMTIPTGSYTYADFVDATNRYTFYEYNSAQMCNEQISGLINWNDQNTTLDEAISGIDDWYGKDQLVEKMINYMLYEGLGLIEE